VDIVRRRARERERETDRHTQREREREREREGGRERDFLKEQSLRVTAYSTSIGKRRL
jgi:hypothetical protein